ncbi:MAG: hypothetical protein ACO26H_02180 [Sediminibacterium sp.]
MDKETFVDKVEKIITKINGLSYRFSDNHTQEEADTLLQSARESLEDFLYLVEGDDFGEEDE